jgi:hypothetical protein
MVLDMSCMSMRAFQPSSPRTLIAIASLWLGACDAGRSVQLDDINDSPPSTAGRLIGVISRANGAPAQGLVVNALNHGAVVYTATTSGSGEFSMIFVNVISLPAPGDTLLTYFVQARTAIGNVSDSLVLREPVQVRMSRNLNVPLVTTVALRAAY